MVEQGRSLRYFCRAFLFVVVLGLGLVACSTAGGSGGSSQSSPTPTSVPLKVTRIDITVGPSLDGQSCGTQFTDTRPHSTFPPTMPAVRCSFTSKIVEHSPYLLRKLWRKTPAHLGSKIA